MSEQNYISKSRNLNNFRLVANKKRARLLNKRGEFIFWDKVHECWVWKPGFRKQFLGKANQVTSSYVGGSVLIDTTTSDLSKVTYVKVYVSTKESRKRERTRELNKRIKKLFGSLD